MKIPVHKSHIKDKCLALSFKELENLLFQDTESNFFVGILNFFRKLNVKYLKLRLEAFYVYFFKS